MVGSPSGGDESVPGTALRRLELVTGSHDDLVCADTGRGSGPERYATWPASASTDMRRRTYGRPSVRSATTNHRAVTSMCRNHRPSRLTGRPVAVIAACSRSRPDASCSTRPPRASGRNEGQVSTSAATPRTCECGAPGRRAMPKWSPRQSGVARRARWDEMAADRDRVACRHGGSWARGLSGTHVGPASVLTIRRVRCTPWRKARDDPA